MFSKLLSSVFVALTLFSGCGASTQQVELPPAYAPQYTHQSVKQGQGANSISIALIKPTFSVGYRMASRMPEMDGAYVEAVNRSLLNYFTTNAFTVAGPFDNMEAMTFPEKKQADLVLQTEVDYRWTLPDIKKAAEKTATTWWDGAIDHTISASGTMKLTGTVKFTLWEPLSGQRMWSKDVAASETVQTINIDKTTSNELFMRIWNNAASKVLEANFKETLRQAERYFHPDEVRLVKAQAVELRAKKVY